MKNFKVLFTLAGIKQVELRLQAYNKQQALDYIKSNYNNITHIWFITEVYQPF